MPVLWRNGLRYLRRKPWATLLMIAGVALGVAVVVAIDLANSGARRAFALSTEALTGRATHQIVAGPDGVDEDVYTRLRVEGGLRNLAPVVGGYVSAAELGDQPLQLLGLDPFADQPFRNIFGDSGPETAALSTFLTEPGAILISRDLAERYGVRPTMSLSLNVDGDSVPVMVAGLLEAEDGYSRRTLQGLIVADISTAQEITGSEGFLQRIDVILPDGDEATLAAVEALLPQGVRILTAAARTGTISELTRAFQLNLTAMSLLALVVGMFLIYNTVTFSVVQRRELFGTLRCLGVTDRELFGLVIAEAAFIGLIGSLLGLVLGVVLGRGAVALVSQTINDLYFVLTVNSFSVPLVTLLKGAAIGVLATIVAALPPAREAARVTPRAALRRSGIEDSFVRMAPILSIAGILLFVAGAVGLIASKQSIPLAFAAITGIVIGLALQTPLVTRWSMRLAPRYLSGIFGPMGRMAPRDVAHSLSRSSVAIAALMVAVSVTIGVSLMIDSFRSTVDTWLTQSLQGDIYVTVPGLTAADTAAALAPGIVEMAPTWPGVADVRFLRRLDVDSSQGRVQVAAVSDLRYGPDLFAEIEGTPEQAWSQVNAGAVLVSEPYANRFDLPSQGGVVTLYTPAGPRDFPVVGIYYDYASSAGTVMMDIDNYRRLWSDDTITALALELDAGEDPDAVALAMSEVVQDFQQVSVQPNAALRADAMVIFDRTFAITAALRMLATLVAFVGILFALMALQLERSRELGVLRAVGLTVRQLGRLVLLETGLMGLIAGIMAWPTGLILSLILVYVINVRAFGWTLQMDITIWPFLSALGISMLAALLAGLYPAWRVGRLAVAAVLHGE